MSVESWFERNSNRIDYYVKQPLIGALRGVIVAGCTNPFEVVKLNVQSKDQGIIRAVCDIWNKRGFLGFFNGLPAQVSSMGVKNCFIFPCLSLTPDFRNMTGNKIAGDLITSGSIAVGETIFTNGIDNNRIHSVSKGVNPVDVFKKVFWVNYFKQGSLGAGVFFLRQFSYWSSFMLTEKPIRNSFRKESEERLSYQGLLKASATSSVVVTASGAFFDHLNTYQKSNKEVVSTALKNVKIVQVGRGALIQFVKIGIHNCATLFILEYNDLQRAIISKIK